MGSVWVARHLALHIDVAVKFIREEVGRERPDTLTRFEREARAAARIKSPHVVQTFDHGVTDEGRQYIVMELLEGEALHRVLQRRGPFPLAIVVEIVVQVGRALTKAHELGIVHRDIKPENVFIAQADDGIFCKVLDFGIAKDTPIPELRGVTKPGTALGTPAYMSPEQIVSAAAVDHRADLWALAVTAYQLLTGTLPFEGQNLGQLCTRIIKSDFRPPRELVPELPEAIDDWFTQAFARETAQRFASARALAKALIAAAAPSEEERREAADAAALFARGETSHPGQVSASNTAVQPRIGTLGGSAPGSMPSELPQPLSKRHVMTIAAVILAAGTLVMLAMRSTPPAALSAEPAVSPTVGETPAPSDSVPALPAPAKPIASAPSASPNPDPPSAAPAPKAMSPAKGTASAGRPPAPAKSSKAPPWSSDDPVGPPPPGSKRVL
jgi:serine/threonine-protein kinase